MDRQDRQIPKQIQWIALLEIWYSKKKKKEKKMMTLRLKSWTGWLNGLNKQGDCCNSWHCFAICYQILPWQQLSFCFNDCTSIEQNIGCTCTTDKYVTTKKKQTNKNKTCRRPATKLIVCVCVCSLWVSVFTMVETEW